MITARLATPGIDRPTATVSTRRSGSSRTARTMRSRRTSRSSVAFSRTPGDEARADDDEVEDVPAAAEVGARLEAGRAEADQQLDDEDAEDDGVGDGELVADRVVDRVVGLAPSVTALTKMIPSISGSNHEDSTTWRQRCEITAG